VGQYFDDAGALIAAQLYFHGLRARHAAQLQQPFTVDIRER
jgi:hypothetical protein